MDLISPMVNVLVILTVAIVLFVTERVRIDLVAILVLLALTLTGIISESDALAGFSNPAVITVASILVLSAGLVRTGIARRLGQPVLRLAGQHEARLILVVMASVGLLSGFMNNIGISALMLPVVLEIARRTDLPPSKLLMPLAFASLLGGLTTLIGTAPNILISSALESHGLAPFSLFAFAPFGGVALLTGILYMVLIGRRLLPATDLKRDSRDADNYLGTYQLPTRLFALSLPSNSLLAGKSLAECRLGSALGLNVVSITRGGKARLAPGPDSVLRAGDKLLVEGRLDQLNSLRGWKHLVLEGGRWTVEQLVETAIDFAEIGLADNSELIGQRLRSVRFRRRFGCNVLAVARKDDVHQMGLLDLTLQAGDTLLVHGSAARLRALKERNEFVVIRTLDNEAAARKYSLHKRLIAIKVPKESLLRGKLVAESRLGDAFGLAILGIIREGEPELMTGLGEEFMEGDTLLVQGDSEDLFTLHGLQHLQVLAKEKTELTMLESDSVGMTEVMLSPRTTLAGKTLRSLLFRERFGLTVLAIWHQGRAHRSNLGEMRIRHGDALLVYGDRSKIALLARDPEFLVPSVASEKTTKDRLAPTSVVIMSGVLLAVLMGWQPIHIAAPTGAALMVLTGCLSMDDAYRAIEWRAVVLIGGMLSLSVAMQETGTAELIASQVLGSVAALGTQAVVGALFVITMLAAQVMPTAAVAVLMSPIALDTASNLSLSPHALMMVVAVATSAAFLSPLGHPVNLMVMGLGGYRFGDYARVGAPLVGLLFLLVVLLLPLIWPLTA